MDLTEVAERSTPVPVWRRFIATAFAAGALAHFAGFVAGAFRPELLRGYPLWRHAIFTVVDLATAYIALRRPRLLLAALLLFLTQQLFSHGAAVWDAWTVSRPVDWWGGAVLAFLIVAVVLSARDRMKG